MRNGLTKSLLPLLFLFAAACGTSSVQAPTGLTATPGNAQVSLSWLPVDGATSYNVYYNTTGNISMTGADPSVKGIPGTNTTITNLSNGLLYYFMVTSSTQNGEGSPSNTVTATPSFSIINSTTGVSTGTSTSSNTIPSTATAGASGSGQITVSWAAITGATSYNVYYNVGSDIGTSGTLWLPVAGSPTTTTGTSTIVTGLLSGQKYYFTVVSVIGATASTATAP